MTTDIKAPGKTPAKRAAAPRRKPAARANGNGQGQEAPAEQPYEAPTLIRPPEEVKAAPDHPVYGFKKLYTYQPQDGSDPIEFPHISTCQPTALFFYDNRHTDEMHQAFAWMDLCGIPDQIGRRVFLLPDTEQATLLREWFGGLNLTPSRGVAPPGES